MSTDSAFADACSDRLENPPPKRLKRVQEDARTPDGGFKIKTYYPTWDEMKDFSSFMKKIHADNGNRAGLAKIIPPSGYKPRKAGYDDESLYEMEITHPIKQEVTGEGGLYQQLNVMGKKKMSVRAFKRLSEEKHPTPIHGESESEMDRLFWKNIFTNPSLYGADVPGSLYDEDFEYFNLTRLNTILDNIQDDYGVTIEGVNTTYLYFGMWKSSFCWHTEDVDLYSINYLHTGAPKSWYCIAPEYGKRFERLAASFFPHSFKGCRAFLRHKTTLISPQILKKYSIPFSRCTQQPGEFMVTFPYSYHSGYNHGFNIAEATNFALEYWIDFGKWATRCECSAESVKISMQTFVKRYQADRYDDWIQGKDICSDPRDPKHKGPAPRPNEYDLYLRGAHERTEADVYEEEERNRKEVALQQNLSCNVKKSKSSKKLSNKLKSDYERYSEYLRSHNEETTNHISPLPHYSPLPTLMVDATEPFTGKDLDDISMPVADRNKPDYNHLLSKRTKKIKTKREEKVSLKKEKRAKERIIMSHELLHYLPTTFTQEKKFNRCIAAQPPHCSICQLLVPHPKDEEMIWGTKPTSDAKQPSLDSQSSLNSQESEEKFSPVELPSTAGPQVEEFKLPSSSLVLLPRFCFAPSRAQETEPNQEMSAASQQVELREGDSGYGDFLEFDLDKPSELLQCAVCMLAVHKLCYGLDKTPESKTDWVCDRCIEANRSTISCVLCPCRGGALKQINGTWAHISCALTLSNVTLTDLISRKDFKLPDIPERNTCIHCANNMSLSKYIQGYTITCNGYDNSSTCSNTFHPTCGHRNGAVFDSYDFHEDPSLMFIIKAICSECVLKTYTVPAADYEAEIKKELELKPISKGARVIVESRKGHFADGIVEDRKSSLIYDIYFPELSTVELRISESMLINKNKSKELRLGDEVRVRSVKGERIGKIYSKRLDELNYVIRLDRSNQIERIGRKDIYLNIDQMSHEQIETYLAGNRANLSENESAT